MCTDIGAGIKFYIEQLLASTRNAIMFQGKPHMKKGERFSLNIVANT